MKTVGDLKHYLSELKMSPEQLAPRVKISNMTLRRLLRRPSQTLIPEKYRVQLQLLSVQPIEVSGMESYLEKQAEAEGPISEQTLNERLAQKCQDPGVEPTLREKAEELFSLAFTSTDGKARAIAIGAILYFINPFDLIPDFTGVLGYVDDLGVLTYAYTFLKYGKR